MKFTTLIPLRYNDGTAVSQNELQNIQREFWMKYGGATVEGIVQGYWLDDGTLYEDECLKMVVSCENERLEEVQQHIIQIGKRLKQEAMYFEVQYFDGVRILKTD